MSFKASSLEELRARVDLPEFLSSYLELKRAGSVYKALCPFHEEKSPSFVVKPGDRHYHCFGCGAHGDAISFLVELQGMRFQDAVELLADKYGLVLQREHSSSQGPDRKRFTEIMIQAQLFFAQQLQREPQAKRYLLARGFPPASWSYYRLGYAPASSYALKKALNAEKIRDAEMMELGLLRPAKEEGGRARDFFVHRLVFPIDDAMGRPIAFSARAIDDKAFGGKYINSPETPLFKKARTLYGLSFCRSKMVKEQRVIIVEGQFDVISLIDAGLNMTVCALGTAFGTHHAQELKRMGIKRAHLLFDGDDAGRSASIKAGLALHSVGIDVEVVALPQGKDPDDLLHQGGVSAIINYLEQGAKFLEFWYRKEAANGSLTPASKVHLVREMASLLQKEVHDPLLHHESLLAIAQLAGIPPEIATKSLIAKKTPPAQESSSSPPEKSFEGGEGATKMLEGDGLEADFLRWLLSMGSDASLFLALARKQRAERFLSDVRLRWLYHWFERWHSAQKEKGAPCTLLEMVQDLPHAKVQDFAQKLLGKRMDQERARALFVQTINDLIKRQWRWDLQEIREQLSAAQIDEERALNIAKEYAELSQKPPALLSLEDLEAIS